MSVEWFDGVDKYDVMTTTTLPQTFPGASITERVAQELSSVFNVGVGVEYIFTDQFTAYSGLTTDQSAAVPGTETRHSASTWDIYHISSGAAIRFSGLDLTLGLRYSFGSQDVERVYSPDDAVRSDPLEGGEVVYRAWKGIIGFAFSI